MSKFKDFASFKIGIDERIMEINGPEIFKIIEWYDIVKSKNQLLASESKSIIEILDRGPIFDHYEPILLKLKQLGYLEIWHKEAGKPTDEISNKILEAIAAAKMGKKRPDLQPKTEQKKESSKI